MARAAAKSKTAEAPEAPPTRPRRRAVARTEDLVSILEVGGYDQPAQGRIVQIFEVACRMFAQNGFDGVSMRDIALECGISKATLYHYFPDKDSLLRPLAMGVTKALYLHVARHDDPALPAADRLRSLIGETARFFDRHRWAWIASASTFWNDPELRFRRERIGWRDRYERLLREILEAGVAAGELRTMDVAVAGRMILGAVNWMARWYDPKGTLTAPEIALDFCDMVLGGILVPTARGRRTRAEG
ncbi:TetR/AcrR family transcriptional regulator [Roseomonas sp. HJA6]|uniref:TetR/AcrR family transcriptional regulator n=1 Tax=Roseomonas alba TaxID=2846776 RepID=A0ABS7ADW6_9PROT|nr:TetR/AcrR family transcriptional regulator [Neoroseomonas alba]